MQPQRRATTPHVPGIRRNVFRIARGRGLRRATQCPATGNAAIPASAAKARTRRGKAESPRRRIPTRVRRRQKKEQLRQGPRERKRREDAPGGSLRCAGIFGDAAWIRAAATTSRPRRYGWRRVRRKQERDARRARRRRKRVPPRCARAPPCSKNCARRIAGRSARIRLRVPGSN